jgi:hypothetical protein
MMTNLWLEFISPTNLQQPFYRAKRPRREQAFWEVHLWRAEETDYQHCGDGREPFET